MTLSSSYFIRSDLMTYSGYPMNSEENDGRFLGGEIVGRLYWAPVSDVMVTLGAGVFLPFLGNIAPEAKNLWRGELGLVLSLF